MELSFSMDWVFIGLTLGCVVFLLQILVDYNRQAAQIRPQIQHAAEIQDRHTEELEKVERLIEEALREEGELDRRIADLEKRQKELETKLKQVEEEQESET